MVTIKDIARAAGVSPATVSNALNGKANVSKETQARILQLCEEMNFHPNAVSRAQKKSNNDNTILFSFSDFDRDFYLNIINGISDYVQAQNYNLIISTNKSCERFMDYSYTRGCIMLDYRMSTETLLHHAKDNYPIIALDRMIDHPNIKSIVVNNYDAMCDLVQGLIDRGYKKFSFLGGIETQDNIERFQGFSDTLSNSGIQFHRQHYLSGNYKESSGYRVAKIIMLSEELPEVLICANDNMAIGAIKAFRENNIKVPGDIAVTGFDDCSLAEAFGLTTIAVPNYERGYLAAQYLIENIRGMNKFETFKISSKVIWRSSVADHKE